MNIGERTLAEVAAVRAKRPHPQFAVLVACLPPSARDRGAPLEALERGRILPDAKRQLAARVDGPDREPFSPAPAHEHETAEAQAIDSRQPAAVAEEARCRIARRPKVEEMGRSDARIHGQARR
jgi:hypothetical protein